jgi:hypothetical protein
VALASLSSFNQNSTPKTLLYYFSPPLWKVPERADEMLKLFLTTLLQTPGALVVVRELKKKSDIKHQLNWVKEMNFGGVEICWLYPCIGTRKCMLISTTVIIPSTPLRRKWLSPEWSEMVAYAKSYADSIGLTCPILLSAARGLLLPPTWISPQHTDL